MLRIALFKNGTETEDDIMRIAKKGGYDAIKREDTNTYISYDLIKRKSGAPSKRVPKEKIEALKMSGATMEQIAKHLNISRSSLYKYLK